MGHVTKQSISVIVAIALSLSLILSASAVYTWSGNVTIGTNTSTNGAKIGAYNGPNLFQNPSTTGDNGPASSYQVDVGCSAGNTVFLKVWGINASVVTCNLGPGDGNTTNLSVSTVAAGGACTYTAACTTGVCCSGSTEVNDGTTSTASCAASCASTTTTSNSGGGGGSSGGGGGGSSFSSESSTPTSIPASSSASLKFTKAAKIAVSEVVISTTDTATNVKTAKVSVSETAVGSGISNALISANSGKSIGVYKYLSITKQNIQDADIKDAKIRFEVPASWFTTEKRDPSKVSLNRYVNGQWVALNTVRVESSGSVYIYEATTPGFSIFAISAEALSTKLTSFELIDVVRAFYAGTSSYSAFEIIDLIRDFYKG